MIELLVVIAVIAILAALLLPTLSRAKMAGDSAVCKSNQRQLLISLSMYVQEEGQYPFILPISAAWSKLGYLKASYPTNNYTQVNGTWTYLGPQDSAWVCPAYNRIRGWVGGGSSYGYNCFGSINDNLSTVGLFPYTVGNQPAVTSVYIRESQVLVPTEMIAIGDAILETDSERGGEPLSGFGNLSAFGITNSTFYKSVFPGLPANDSAVRAMKERHGGRWNIGFCDGHIEALSASGLFDAGNPLQMRRWNNDHQPHGLSPGGP